MNNNETKNSEIKNVFCVGYNGKLEDLKRVISSSDNVGSVYTGGLSDKIKGGRYQYASTLKDLEDQVNYAHDHNVKFELAINASCNIHEKSDKEWWNETKEYVKLLESVGVDGVAVSHPFIMDVVKSHTNLQLIISTICDIRNVRSALYYEDLGGDVIIPSYNINYDLEELKKIKKALTTAKLRIMINEYCLGDCPFRNFHYNYLAHYKNDTPFLMKCTKRFLRDPYLVLTNNTVRPEDLHNYHEITNDFKLVRCIYDIDELLLSVKAYSQGHFEGNVVRLSHTKLSKQVNIPNEALGDLFKMKAKCDNVCDDCKYCQKLYEKIQKEYNL